jgi:hypothetical protein
MQGQHRQLLIFQAIRGHFAAFPIEDEGIGTSLVLDDLETVMDFATRRLLMEILTQKQCFNGLPQLCQGLIGGMLEIAVGKPFALVLPGAPETKGSDTPAGCPH